jgi:DDE superfamily endonuclease
MWSKHAIPSSLHATASPSMMQERERSLASASTMSGNYQWAAKGTRPRQPKDQRYANAYLFGAICPARDIGSALVLPRADAIAMQHHLDEISRCVAAGAHAVVALDKAGWHTTPKLQVPAHISLLHLPPASPELNPTENVWQYLRQTYLSNRVFRDYDDVVDASSSVLGISSLPSQAGSHQLPDEAGQPSVKVREDWY